MNVVTIFLIWTPFCYNVNRNINFERIWKYYYISNHKNAR